MMKEERGEYVSTEERKKLDPKALQTALLDEIAERLHSIQKLAQAEVPEGAVEPIEKFTITEQKTHIRRLKPWFSFTLINDGPHSVFTIVNTEKSFEEHEVMHDETYTINMTRAVIKDLLMWCNHGETADIRLVGVR